MAKNGRIALGIDGGATAMKWALRDAEGAIQTGQVAGANCQQLGLENFSKRLGEVIEEALRTVGAGEGSLATLGMGLAGVDRPAEREYLRTWARERFPKLRQLWVGNDALPALRLGAGRLDGIVLLAGTGSFCVGVPRAGESVRVGGWGARLGDEGSGLWIGRRALQLAACIADERHRPSPLMGAVLRALGLSQPAELIPWASGLSEAQFRQAAAGLTPVVMKLAREGERAAAGLLEQAARELAQHVLAAAHQLTMIEQGVVQREGGEGPSEPAAHERTVVCAGGLFSEADGVYDRLAGILAETDPPLRPTRLTQPHALGALALADETPA